MLKIGSYQLPTNIIMAPMSGCTDLPFRLIAREEGAGLCFLEMIDCNSLTHNPDRTINTLLKTDSKDRPIAAQLVGADPGAMSAGAQILLEQVSVPFLDINAACPVNKIVKKKAGAYLLQKPLVLSKIIKRLIKDLKIPITVKLRIGYEKYDKRALVGIVKKCEDSGAAAIFIHGRTMAQLYHSDVNYEAIKVVKQNVAIPVFGSGNVMSPELAKKMLDSTGCDGVMVARGGLGNPFIFKEIEHYLKTGELLPAVSFQKRKETLKRHLAYSNKYLYSKGRVGVMRKIAIWYLKKFPGAAHFRDRVTRTNSYEDMIKLIDEVGA
ncbi:MAG: tRNA dihydrouridine synthase DusB [Candidatus Margulisbacteria bacterium]|nr:tRNA dihydrouridine synthase DusB [Candidatus Margulisiibacteriota bacterium]